MSKEAAFSEGQRVVYTKRGERRCFDTEWPAVYLRLSPAGKHVIRIDGFKRVSLVRAENLHAAAANHQEYGQ